MSILLDYLLGRALHEKGERRLPQSSYLEVWREISLISWLTGVPSGAVAWGCRRTSSCQTPT